MLDAGIGIAAAIAIGARNQTGTIGFGFGVLWRAIPTATPIPIPAATVGSRRIDLQFRLKRRLMGLVHCSFLLRVSEALKQLLQDVTQSCEVAHADILVPVSFLDPAAIQGFYPGLRGFGLHDIEEGPRAGNSP